MKGSLADRLTAPARPLPRQRRCCPASVGIRDAPRVIPANLFKKHALPSIAVFARASFHSPPCSISCSVLKLLAAGPFPAGHTPGSHPQESCLRSGEVDSSAHRPAPYPTSHATLFLPSSSLIGSLTPKCSMPICFEDCSTMNRIAQSPSSSPTRGHYYQTSKIVR
jgi:hypothetical protein